MLLRCLLIVMVSGSAFAANARDVFYQGSLNPLNIAPTFDNGYLAVYDYDSKITLYGADGLIIYSAAPRIAEASYITVLGVGVDTDGTLAATIQYRAAKTFAERAGIVVFDRSGTQTRFFETGSYFPTQVSFGPDHSIWSMGYRRHGAAADSDYFVLRNYSLTGQELAAFLPRSSFASEPDPVGPNVGGKQIRVANGKIGMIFYASSILHPGQQQRPMLEWMETDLKGQELGRMDVPPSAEFVLMPGGALYSQVHGIKVLERATNSWRPVAGMPDGILLGSEGDSLVFQLTGSSALRWVPTSQSVASVQ